MVIHLYFSNNDTAWNSSDTFSGSFGADIMLRNRRDDAYIWSCKTGWLLLVTFRGICYYLFHKYHAAVWSHSLFAVKMLCIHTL